MAGNVNNDGCSVLVISPLKSIISDQISYLQSINNTAVEMSNKTFVDIVRSPPQFIYATADQVIDQKFMKEIKSMTSILHHSIVAVVMDESHTVETWGAKRAVSESDKHELQSALEELQNTLTKNPDRSAFGTTFSQGFSSELISDVIQYSNRIFSLEDILTHTPVFNLHHAIQIFEITAEMFDDIDEYHLTNNAPNLENLGFSYTCIDELLNVDYDSSNVETLPDPDL
ncbi:Hypothetical predicted protein [Paramuricea clavata]|uniref:DEAD/DEAH-box helicase domain-containing protein n=1 Tax=Paramuricea clavata TaxID=317549 RepID=A0A6S7HH45_PARCT|nr:Hypothetical predicted protein [Paramuricea clavata]